MGRRRRNRRRGRRRYITVAKSELDYKKPDQLRTYLTEYGRIRPRRQTGLSAKSQRRLAQQVKRARHLALLPFVDE